MERRHHGRRFPSIEASTRMSIGYARNVYVSKPERTLQCVRSTNGSICLFDAGTLCSLYSHVSRAPLHGQPVSFPVVHAGPGGFRMRRHVRTRRTDFRSAGRHAFSLRLWAVPAAEPTLECPAPSLEEYTREHQAYLSAEAHPASSCLGLSRPNGDQEWPCRHQRPTPQGTSFVVGFNRG